MKRLRKYVKSFELGLQSSMEYRTNFLLSIFSTVFPTIIQIFLWTAIFSHSQSPTVYGYTYTGMITYTLLAGVVSKLVSAGVEWDVANDIKDGGLNKFIVRPIGYFLFRISCFFGQKVLQLGIIGVIITVVLMAVRIELGFYIEPLRILLFAVSIIMAIVLNLFLSLIISTVAFWITEAWAAFMILNLFVNISGGGVFPLDIFGETAMKIMNLLPFQYTIYFPINIINGKTALNDAAWGIVLQGVWIILLILALKAVWSMGMKKYIAVGG